jgi:hypothetical protein
LRIVCLVYHGPIRAGRDHRTTGVVKMNETFTNLAEILILFGGIALLMLAILHADENKGEPK